MKSSKPTKVGGFQRQTEIVDCGLCGKPVDVDEGWNWDEEPSHRKCVIEKANWRCKAEEPHYQEFLNTESGVCEECGKPMLKLRRIPRKAKALRILRVRL